MGEFQQAIGPHLSHADFAANEALLLLSLLAFNLVSALRIEYEGAAGSCFDLARFQRDVLKADGRVVKHARRLVLQLAQVITPFWKQPVGCLQRWKLPPRFPQPRGPQARPWRPLPRHALQFEARRQ